MLAKKDLQTPLLDSESREELDLRRAAFQTPESYTRDPTLPQVVPAHLNREQLEYVRILYVSRTQLRQKACQLLTLAILVALITLAGKPVLFSDARGGSECEARLSFANSVFAWVVLGSFMAARLVFLTAYLLKSRTSPMALNDFILPAVLQLARVDNLVSILGAGIWFFCSIRQWVLFDASQCLQGTQAVANFVLFIALDLLTALAGLGLLCLCCSQLIVSSLSEGDTGGTGKEVGGSGSAPGSFMERLARLHFNENDFKENPCCIICYHDFSPTDEVCPLPCSLSHYFHPYCIEDYVAKHSRCPLCQQQVSLEQLQEFSDDIEDRVARDSPLKYSACKPRHAHPH